MLVFINIVLGCTEKVYSYIWSLKVPNDVPKIIFFPFVSIKFCHLENSAQIKL